MLNAKGELRIKTPRWSLPLLEPATYKGAKGGRTGGKSHFFAELAVEEMVADPYTSVVALREVQRSLRFSVKRLVTDKISRLGVSHLFEIRDAEIRRKGRNGLAPGIMIFEGMQDHTADSIKSLEDFRIAWYEEAQRMSARSLELLEPTIIRHAGAQIWFSWNPDQPDDPVEELMVKSPPADSIVVHVNFQQNTFRDPKVDALAAQAQRRDPDSYNHTWLGGYNTKSDDQILSGCWRVDEFEPESDWDGPYFGVDWGFSVSPTASTECYIHNDTLFVYYEVYDYDVETEDLPAFLDRNPRIKGNVIRGDNARPENISHLKRHGYPRIQAARKWPKSVEAGISYLRGLENIVIHEQCVETIREARLWKYQRNKKGDVTNVIIKKHDNSWDSIRYSLDPYIKPLPTAAAW